MKFKILKGADLFEKLMQLRARCGEARDAAYAIMDELGATAMCEATGIHTIAGGITALQFESKPDEGWRKAYPKDYSNAYFPKKIKKNKELLDRIDSLPKVATSDLNLILGYDMWNRENESQKRVSFHPSVNWSNDDVILVEVAEYVKYTPLPDMIEITVSEYNKLKNSGGK